VLSEAVARKCGVVSFWLFLSQLAGLCFATLLAFTAGGGGHPPGGALILVFAGVGVIFLAPVGVVLGLLALSHRNAKAITGLVGNGLLFLVVWVTLKWVFGLRI